MVIVMLFAFVGCGDTADQGEKKIKVAIINENTFGTQAYVDVALAGAQRAADELGIELVTVEKVSVPQYADTCRTLITAQDVNVILAISANQVDSLLEVANEFPEVYCVSMDYASKENPENFMSYSYKEHESAFVIGAFTALMTKTNKVAFIGGVEGGAMVRFESGFLAGANYINKDIDTSVAYVGWADTTKGKETATMLYKNGYDWIAPAAGASNLGVFQASKEIGGDKWVCGAADGQFHIMPDRIVVSQVKKIDNTAYNVIKDIVEGNFKGGESIVLGVAEDGVGIIKTPNADLINMVPQDVWDRIAQIEKDVTDGTIKVPATKEELASFLK